MVGEAIVKIGAQIGKSFRSSTREVGKTLKKFASSARQVGRSMSFYVSAPLAAVSGFAVNAYGQVEQMETAFTAMLGSGERARDMMKDLIKWAEVTPFELPGIGQATRVLLAFGVSQEEMIGKLQFLGDIASGTQSEIEDIAMIYGRMKGLNKATNRALYQLVQRGVPILKILSDGYGISIEAVQDMVSKGEVGFDVIEQAMQSMNQEGAIFNNMMIKQSQTIFGLWSTLSDVIFFASSAFGEVIVDSIDLRERMRELIVWIEESAKSFKVFAKERPGLVKVGLAIGAIVVVAGPLLLILGLLIPVFTTAAAGIGAIYTAVTFLIPAIWGLGAALLATPVGWIIAAVAGIAAVAWLIYDNWGPISEWFMGMWDRIVIRTRIAWEGIKLIVLSGAMFIVNKVLQLMSLLPESLQTHLGVSGLKDAAGTLREMQRQSAQTAINLVRKGNARPGSQGEFDGVWVDGPGTTLGAVNSVGQDDARARMLADSKVVEAFNAAARQNRAGTEHTVNQSVSMNIYQRENENPQELARRISEQLQDYVDDTDKRERGAFADGGAVY